jgi:hypothetical protein
VFGTVRRLLSCEAAFHKQRSVDSVGREGVFRSEQLDLLDTGMSTLPSSLLIPRNALVVTGPNSWHLGPVVPVPKTGLRGDCDCVKRVSKAGHEMTEYGKHGKPKSRLSTLPTLLGNPCGITTFPPPRLLAYFKMQGHERPNPEAFRPQGVVMEVLGSKCNERSSTLIPARATGALKTILIDGPSKVADIRT